MGESLSDLKWRKIFKESVRISYKNMHEYTYDFC